MDTKVEPIFFLLARDPLAPYVVRLWAEAKRYREGDGPKVTEAITCAKTMSAWYDDQGYKSSLDVMTAIHDAMHQCLDVIHAIANELEEQAQNQKEGTA